MSVRVGAICMSDPSRSVIVKIQLNPSSSSSGPTKSITTEAPRSSGTSNGCNGPLGFVRGHAFPTFSVVLRCHTPPSDVGAHRAYHGPYRVTSHLRIYHVPALLDLAYV